MKHAYIGLVILALLAGCAQLMHGQEQPVITKNPKENIYYTTCSGTVEHWVNCYNKASRTCSKGYSTIDKTDNANGGIRNMTFKCN